MIAGCTREDPQSAERPATAFPMAKS
jgi:hypothetical protein